MSRTKGHKKKQTDYDETKRHKMKAYVADKEQGRGKFVSELDEKDIITKGEKLITTNANRSRKKGARQQAEKEINEILKDEDISKEI